MFLTMLQGKLHNARITGRHLDYHGSVSIDEDLIEAAGMRVGQQIQVYDSSNGSRFETYIIRGERGSGTIQVNGAAARLVEENDRVIICTFIQLSPEEADKLKPTVVICDENNKAIETITYN